MRRGGIWLILISIALSIAIPLAYGGGGALSALRDVPATAFALALLLAVLSWLCNAGRLALLARALGVKISAGYATTTAIAGEFAAVTTPMGSGSLPAHVLLLSRRGLSAGNTIAVLAMDRVTDLIFFAAALPLAFASLGLAAGNGDLRVWAMAAGVLLLGALCLMFALVRHHRAVIAGIGRLSARFPALNSRRRLTRMLIHFRNSMQQLFKMRPGALARLFILCVGHWLTRYSILPVLLWSTGHTVPWSYLFIVQGLALFAGQVSMLPGGSGGVEVAMSVLLRPYLSPAVTAASLLGWRFITFHCSLLAGALVLPWLMGRRSTRTLAHARTVE